MWCTTQLPLGYTSMLSLSRRRESRLWAGCRSRAMRASSHGSSAPSTGSWVRMVSSMVTRFSPMYVSGPYMIVRSGICADAVRIVLRTFEDVQVMVGTMDAETALVSRLVLMYTTCRAFLPRPVSSHARYESRSADSAKEHPIGLALRRYTGTCPKPFRVMMVLTDSDMKSTPRHAMAVAPSSHILTASSPILRESAMATRGWAAVAAVLLCSSLTAVRTPCSSTSI
mmetsp:Transcript_32149/g.96330  ORF Transcript_32149/g.96330 Transcript_32149/m.96330 type:complete len:227 (-) Transcript_32149:546-1226(-)